MTDPVDIADSKAEKRLPNRSRQASAILTYHSLDDSHSVISTSPSTFRKQIEFLAASGIPVVPLDQVTKRPGSVALTFDDGFQNLAEHAFPLLKEHNFPSTVFVVSRYCGKFNNWPSQPVASVPLLPLLGWDELGMLDPLVAVGAHTATHPDLRNVSVDECEFEMETCRDDIRRRLGLPVRLFAYPYGSSTPAVRLAAGRNFDSAVGTSLRFLAPGDDDLNLPRLDTYYLRGRFPIEHLFGVRGTSYIRFRRMLRSVGGLVRSWRA